MSTSFKHLIIFQSRSYRFFSIKYRFAIEIFVLSNILFTSDIQFIFTFYHINRHSLVMQQTIDLLSEHLLLERAIIKKLISRKFVNDLL